MPSASSAACSQGHELRCVSRTCANAKKPAGARLAAASARADSPCFSGWMPESPGLVAFRRLRLLQRPRCGLAARRPAAGNPKRPRFCGLPGPGSLRSPSPANLTDRKPNRLPIFLFEKNRDPGGLGLLSGPLGLPAAARAASGARALPPNTIGRWGGLSRVVAGFVFGSPNPPLALRGLRLDAAPRMRFAPRFPFRHLHRFAACWLQRHAPATDAAGQLATLAYGRRCRAGGVPRRPPRRSCFAGLYVAVTPNP